MSFSTDGGFVPKNKMVNIAAVVLLTALLGLFLYILLNDHIDGLNGKLLKEDFSSNWNQSKILQFTVFVITLGLWGVASKLSWNAEWVNKKSE
jgi:hypothetical protein